MCVCVCVWEGGGPAFGSLIVHVWAVSVCVCVCVWEGGGPAFVRKMWFIDCVCVGCECVSVCVCVWEGGGPAFGSLIVHVWAVSVCVCVCVCVRGEGLPLVH